MVWVPERASWHIEGLSWDRFIKVIHYDFEMLLYTDESYGAFDTSLAGQEGSSKQKSSGGIDERASSPKGGSKGASSGPPAPTAGERGDANNPSNRNQSMVTTGWMYTMGQGKMIDKGAGNIYQYGVAQDLRSSCARALTAAAHSVGTPLQFIRECFSSFASGFSRALMEGIATTSKQCAGRLK